ncbi:hypothetical protein H6P81_007702 [Aristolochia fimbriata]|uniref:KHG/KDPG aldolase n=1 Tax=Aristolochia fimbriata TaxID=158543 RepID=A0AAV7F1B1_ARIFI|nr:hypothetical protein H6P81_007702 [Aristolochia fimbriata]
MASMGILSSPFVLRNSLQSRLSGSPRRRTMASFPPSETLAEIEKSGVIACLRAGSGKLAMEAARAALGAGVSVLEIVMSTPGVLEVIQGLAHDHPASIIGAGTVLTTKDARNAIEAGAKFLMSPATVKEILDEVHGSNILYIPGVMTPTEVLNAYYAGARVVKVYPVSALGGPQYISAIKKPFSHIPMVASQGITLDSARTYIAQGASAVVLSDAIFEKQAMQDRNFNVIYQRAYSAALNGREAVKMKKGEK